MTKRRINFISFLQETGKYDSGTTYKYDDTGIKNNGCNTRNNTFFWRQFERF